MEEVTPIRQNALAQPTVEGNWQIICNDKIFNDGVAVAFFYTDNEIITSYTGAYRETENIGLITEVKDNRNLVSINKVSALKKYADWINVNPNDLKSAIEGAVSLNIKGFNVTIPHKVDVMQYLDELDEVARLIGAVNTIDFKNLKGWAKKIF